MQLANLSQPECEIFFQYWVVTERQRSPNLSHIERLTCPVLWCGINFDNEASLLCHLKDCPHLSASYYWCPRCHRAESFASYKRPVPSPSCQSPVQKRPSPLKKLLHKHFCRKSASVSSQDPTMKPNHHPHKFYSHHNSYHNYHNPIGELDGQGSHGYYVPSELSSERGAPIGTLGQQNNTLSSPDTLNTNREPVEMPMPFWLDSVEKDGDEISELNGDPIMGNSSFPESSQSNELSDRLPLLSPQVSYDFFKHIDDTWPIPEPTGQGQIDGRNPAAGIVDQQDIPSVDYRELRPTNSDHDPSLIPNQAEAQNSWYLRANPDHAPNVYPVCHTQNRACSAIESTTNAINFLAYEQEDRQSQPYPATGPVNSLLAASYKQTCSSHPQDSPNYVPISTNSAYGFLHTQTLANASFQPRINTTNIPAGGHRVPRGHPNPETRPVNSPLSASSNQTNTTWSNDSMGTVPTPVTTFSDSHSPAELSPLRGSNSAQPSSNPQQSRYTCKECGRTIKDRSNFKRHGKHKHGNVDPIPCRAGCGEDFTRSDNERRHYAREYKKESNKKGRGERFFGVHLAFSQK